MTVATAADVSARVGRPLTEFETARVTAFLQDLEAKLNRLKPALLTDPDWIPAVRAVECSVVIRAARLPDSLAAVVPVIEGAGFASAPAVQGALYLRREEKRDLGLPLIGPVSIGPEPKSPSVPGWDEGWFYPDYSFPMSSETGYDW